AARSARIAPRSAAPARGNGAAGRRADQVRSDTRDVRAAAAAAGRAYRRRAARSSRHRRRRDARARDATCDTSPGLLIRNRRVITSGLTRKPAFWIAYALAAVAAIALAWQLFPLAIPLVNLDIRLARDDAIAKAEAVAQSLKLAPEGARAAAR